MEASTTEAQTPSPSPVPAAAPAPASTPAPAAPVPATKDRRYGVYVEVEVDVSSAAGRKEAMDALSKIECDGVVLARVNRAAGALPRKALENLAEIRDLDGDYKVIAESAINDFPGVKTASKRSISFG